MASLTVSFAAALTACWSAAPQPITTVVTNADTGFRVTNVQAFNSGVNSQGATGATGSSTGININFDQAVDRASVERAISVFDGEVNNATNPATSTALGLTSMCNGHWRVRNPNATPISFTWDAYKTTQNGAGVVPANTDAFFTSSLGANTVRVFVNGKQQQTKATNPANCTSSALSFAWAADSKSVVASPKTALVLNKTYSVVVSTNAKNSSGSAALSVPFVSKVVVQENLNTKGMLVPGGSFTSKDGVRIVAPIGSISSPVEISVMKRNEPAESFGELASVFEPIAIYKISSNPIAEVDSELLQLYFPVPNTANLDDYVLLQLGSVDGTTAASSGSGAKSWSYVHRNYEKRAEILEEDGVLNFDFYMIARTSVIKTPKKALSINSVSVPSFVPDCFGVENCDDLSAQVQSILKTEYSILVSQLGLDDAVLLNRIILKKSQIDLFDKDCGNDTFAYYDSMKSKLQFCIDVEMNGNVVNGKLRSGNYLSKTVRHELFHALQFEKLFRAGVRAENPNSFTYLGQYPPNLENKVYYNVGRRWILEGTATTIEYSDLSKFNRQTRGYVEGIPDRDLFKSTSTLKENKSPVVLENDMYETQDFWVFSGQNTFRKSKWNLNYLLTVFSSGLKTAFPTQELDATFQTLGYPGGLKSAYWEWSKNQSYERFENLENLNSAPCSANLSTTFPDFSKRVAQDGFRPPIYVEDLSKALTYNFSGNADQIKDKPFTVSSLTTRVISVNFLNAINNGINVSFKSQGDFKYKVYRNDQPLPTPDACKGFKDAEASNPIFPITPGTKLFILAANVGLENSSSFTLTVEPVTTKPVVKQLTPAGPQNVIDNPVVLEGVEGQTVTTTLVLTNEGATSTIMDYTAYPIGQYVYGGSVSSAGYGKKVKAKRIVSAGIRYPTAGGDASDVIYSNNLSSLKVGKIRHVSNTDAVGVPDKLEIPVSAKCRTIDFDRQYYYGGYYDSSSLQIVYSTGLIDDYGTPNDPIDDKPELEVLDIPIQLTCSLPPAPIARVDLKTTYGVKGISNTVVLNLSNSGNGTMQFNAGSAGGGALAPGESMDLTVIGLPCKTDNGIYYYLQVPFSISSNDPVNPVLNGEQNIPCVENRPVLSLTQPNFGGSGENGRSYQVRNHGGANSVYEFIAPNTTPIYGPNGLFVGTAKIKPGLYFQEEFQRDALYLRRMGTLEAFYGYDQYVLEVECPVAGEIDFPVEVRDVTDSSVSDSYRQRYYCEPRVITSKQSGPNMFFALSGNATWLSKPPIPNRFHVQLGDQVLIAPPAGFQGSGNGQSRFRVVRD